MQNGTKYLVVGIVLILVVAVVAVFVLLAQGYTQTPITTVNYSTKSTTSADAVDSSLKDSDELLKELEKETVPDLDLEADFGL